MLDSASGKRGIIANGVYVPSGVDFTAAGVYAEASNDALYNLSGNMSIICGITLTASSGVQQFVLSKDDYDKRIIVDNSYGDFLVKTQFGTLLNSGLIGGGSRTGVHLHISYTGSSSGQNIYLGNRIIASDANTNGTTVSSRKFTWGRGTDGSEVSSTLISEYTLLYKLALPAQQIAALSANPWQIYEPETVWIEVGGGAEAALFAGSVYGQSFASAQLSTAITIASQVVAAGSISGGINTAIRLATSAQGSSSASALLTTAIRMAASAQGHGASTADLSTTIALAADILAASSASGSLSTAIRFGGALSGASTTTAALSNAITMAAQVVGLGSISGQLAGTVAAALFAGTISGSSSVSANLSTAVVLAAAAQGSSTAQAALSTALELAAQVNGFGSATGALGPDISGLAGSLSGSSEAQATLSTAIHLMGVAAGQCGVVGRLAEPVEILAQLRVMASDPLALSISVRDPLALRVTVQ